MDNKPFEGKSYYRLKQIDNDGSFEYSEIVEASFMKPEGFALDQNYPNPFNPITKITYSVAHVGTRHGVSVQLQIYDVLGKEVATLVNEEKSPGIYKAEFNATGLPSGIYYYTIKAGSYTATKKITIIEVAAITGFRITEFTNSKYIFLSWFIGN